MERLKIGTDFSGVGSPEQALKNLNIPHQSIFACEIDKYARITYLANHDCETMYEDITTRDHSEVPQLDLYIAGFPCQSFSIAGKRKGFDETRGTLFFNVAEFIKENQPKTFILENVKGLLSHDGGRTMQTIVDVLSNGGGTVNGQMSLDMFEDGLGYHIYYQVLNTKEHGIPQNRERIFIVGFKESRDYRFPKTEPLKLRLKDMLDTDVDEKYYLSDVVVSKIINSKFNQEKTRLQTKDVSDCILARDYKDPKCVKVSEEVTNLQGKEYCNTIRSGGRGSLTDKHNWDIVQVKSATKKGYEEATEGDSINFSVPNSETRRGRVGKGVAQTLDTACNQAVIGGKWNDFKDKQGVKKGFEPLKDGCSPSLLARARNDGSGMAAVSINENIRRLTPRECFRLQNFPDSFDLSHVSDTQAYKQAGNSITVRTIQKIISKIYGLQM